MIVEVVCNKGCGIPIVIDTEAVAKTAEEQGVPTPQSFGHDVCPNASEAVHPNFIVTITVIRDSRADGTDSIADGWVELASYTATREGASFDAVADQLSKDLTDRWDQVLKMRKVIDMP